MQPFNARVGFRGQYRWSILNEDGSPGFAIDQLGRKQTGGEWRANLITQLGMNSVAPTDGGHGAGFGPPGRAYLHVGEGALVIETDSGAITASQSGTTVTASAAIFASTDVGDLVLWGSGETALISAFTDTTHVEVTASAIVAGGVFTIKRTSTDQLVSQVESGNSDGGFGASSSYSFDDPNQQVRGELTVTRVVTMTANRNLTEFGFSPDGTATNLHIVELFRDSGGAPIALTIPSGKKLRLDHTLIETAAWSLQAHEFDLQEYDVTDVPLSVTAATNASPIQITTNFPHNFSTGDQVNVTGVVGNTAANGIWTVTVVDSTTFTLDGSTGNGGYTSGGTVARHLSGNLFPYVTGSSVTGTAISKLFSRFVTLGDNYSGFYDRVLFSTNSQAAPAYPFTGVNTFIINHTEVNPGISYDNYVADSMEVGKSFTFNVGTANGNLYSIGFEGDGVGQVFKFTNPTYFTKDSNHTLTFRFVISWWWSF